MRRLIEAIHLHSSMGDEHEAARAFALGRRLLHEFKRRGSEWDEFFGMAAHYLQEKQWSNVIQMAELLDDGSITEPSEEELRAMPLMWRLQQVLNPSVITSVLNDGANARLKQKWDSKDWAGIIAMAATYGITDNNPSTSSAPLIPTPYGAQQDEVDEEEAELLEYLNGPMQGMIASNRLEEEEKGASAGQYVYVDDGTGFPDPQFASLVLGRLVRNAPGRDGPVIAMIPFNKPALPPGRHLRADVPECAPQGTWV